MFDAHGDRPVDAADPSVRKPADFEHLRWFELPAGCMLAVGRTDM